MAIVADSLAEAGAFVRWVPHPQMPAVGLTKREVKTSGALEHWTKTGHFTPVQERSSAQTPIPTSSRARSQRGALVTVSCISRAGAYSSKVLTGAAS